MSDVEPGFFRADKDDGTPPAYFQVAEGDRYALVYPSGEVARGPAAKILLGQDLLPVCEVERVDREETPFADDVEPIAQ